MHLGALLAAAGLVGAEVVLPRDAVARTDPSPPDPLVTDIVLAAAEVTPGALFACVPGAKADGHDFAAAAATRGAVAVLCERPLDLAMPQVLVSSVRRSLGPLSATFWARPSSAMTVVGVTGTNGKTTTCALLAAIFNAAGRTAGVIGTLTGERTTPEAPSLQRRLAELRDTGAASVAMEVSSHALDQCRVDGTEFAGAVFTNLSQDHLDYHGTMQAYFEAKSRLFTTGMARLAVVNREDPWGERLVHRLTGVGIALSTYSAEDASEVQLTRHGSSFVWQGRRVVLNLAGRFNIANALAAATAASALGVGVEPITEGLASAGEVRGRFELVDAGQDFVVVVDFAHTPAALTEALRAARDLTDETSIEPGKVIVVFGAGGERDHAKRPLMGRVASELADIVVVTSDNPRSEEPSAIIGDVLVGVQGQRVIVEPDRKQAIASALEVAQAGDVVVVAGKGHETGQDFGDHVVPFDDADVARTLLAPLGVGPPAVKGANAREAAIRAPKTAGRQ